MLISRFGVLYSMAAANMDTEMVLPKRRGVDTSTSCVSDAQPLLSRISWWSRANCPGASVFQKMRAHALMNWSWNSR